MLLFLAQITKKLIEVTVNFFYNELRYNKNFFVTIKSNESFFLYGKLISFLCNKFIRGLKNFFSNCYRKFSLSRISHRFCTYYF